MPEDDPPLPAYVWLIILAASVAALAFVYWYIVPNCATLPIRGRVYGDCGTAMAIVYVATVPFLGAAVFSGYRLARAAVGKK